MFQKLDYQKNEGNDRYEKEIETNRDMNVLKIHTFPYNDVIESYLMQDFQKVCNIKMSDNDNRLTTHYAFNLFR